MISSAMRNFLKRHINENKHIKDIVHGAGFTFVAKIIGVFAGLGTSLIIARYYGTEMVGTLAIINAILTIGVVFSLMGTDVAILRLVPEYQQKYSLRSVVKLHQKMTILVIFFSLTMSIGLFFSSPFICKAILHDDSMQFFVRLTACVIFFKALSTLNMETIRGLQQVKVYAFMHLSHFGLNFLLIAFLTLFFFHKNNPLYAIFTNLFIIFLVLFPLVIYLIKRIKTVTKREHLISFKEIISLSFPMFLTSSILMVIYYSDTLMLGIFSTEHEVGIYAISLKLALLTNFVLTSVNSIAAPKFSQLYHSGDLEQLGFVARQSTRIAFWATIPIILIYIVFGYKILELFGLEFTAGYHALLFLMIGQLVNVAAGSVGLFLDMTGHEKIFRNIVVTSGVINIVLNLILIPRYHINGAAIASMISIISWNVLAALYIKKKFGFSISYVPLIRLK